jgi:hypothetical protein
MGLNTVQQIERAIDALTPDQREEAHNVQARAVSQRVGFEQKITSDKIRASVVSKLKKRNAPENTAINRRSFCGFLNIRFRYVRTPETVFRLLPLSLCLR